MKTKSYLLPLLASGLLAAFAHGADYTFIGNGGSFDGDASQWLDGLAPDSTDTAADVIINTGEGGAFYTYMDGKSGDTTGNGYSYNSLTVRKDVGFYLGGPFHEKDVSIAMNYLTVESGVRLDFSFDGSNWTSLAFDGGAARFESGANVSIGMPPPGNVCQNPVGLISFDSVDFGAGAVLTTSSEKVEVSGDVSLADSSTWKITYLSAETVEVAGEFSKEATSVIELDFSRLTLSDGEYELITAGSWVGFDMDDASKNFTISGISEEHSLKWNGNTLVLQYGAIPEPAAVAAVFGALALAFAARRKMRK